MIQAVDPKKIISSSFIESKKCQNYVTLNNIETFLKLRWKMCTFNGQDTHLLVQILGLKSPMGTQWGQK